jgi:hypothetical protein
MGMSRSSPGKSGAVDMYASGDEDDNNNIGVGNDGTGSPQNPGGGLYVRTCFITYMPVVHLNHHLKNIICIFSLIFWLSDDSDYDDDE